MEFDILNEILTVTVRQIFEKPLSKTSSKNNSVQTSK